MKRIKLLAIIISILHTTLYSQLNEGVIKGRVYNSATNEGVSFATLIVWGSTIGTIADEEGNYLLSGLDPGFVEVKVTSVGFKSFVSGAVMVTNSNEVTLDIPLEESEIGLDEVTIRVSPFSKKTESPISVRVIGIDEIEKNPGGNRDISRVIQSFPGVASTPAFRNDIIVRGGGPSENRFYVDNIEIPYLNHFSTQGASGGAVGIINVDFVQSVDYISGAFPASKGNALSSILDFTLIDGNKNKMKYKTTIGASDIGLTFDGPVGKKGSLLMSIRRSYLQFLFSALKLPFLPNYTDFQLKYKLRIDSKNELTVIGLGAVDEFDLNLDADETEYQRYILDYIPVQEQYSYVTGLVYKHYRTNGYDVWVLSRNYLNNSQYKYLNNIQVDTNKTLDYLSGEGEIKARYERTIFGSNDIRVSYGTGYEYAHYRNRTFRKVYSGGMEDLINYNTNLKFLKYGIFGQISKSYFNNVLRMSFGVRSDGNTYSENMSNIFNQISPRFSAIYVLNENFNINFSTGRYFQLPPYTTLGYSSSTQEFINKGNGIKYMGVNHMNAGFEFLPLENIQLSIEGFYKIYSRYPYSVKDSVPLSAKSADYGIFGDEELISAAKGRAYGIELLARMKEFRKINMVFSYTFVRSEFRGTNSEWISSSWDNKHLINLSGTKRFKNHWDFGIKLRFVGGAPYTPYDINKSSLKEAWDLQGQGYLDYSRYNSLRLKAFHQLDIRIDKQYFYSGWSLMLYLDIQNVYNHKADQPDILVKEYDVNGVPITDESDPLRYSLKYLENEAGTIIPTIGMVIEF